MKHFVICLSLLIFMATPFTVLAVDTVDFEMKTTKNLLNLCTASPEDNLYAEAVNFCHGYLIGAYHYYESSRKGPNAQSQICISEPKPSRNDTIDMFVKWAKANKQYHNELPVETEFRFLMETWPCSH
ncbi:MAG: hypothetical protein JRC99_11305 [Deltaproteobacteria bacterium]|nr:hypothetical protein [Deltaproteobacteria bacterium]